MCKISEITTDIKQKRAQKKLGKKKKQSGTPQTQCTRYESITETVINEAIGPDGVLRRQLDEMKQHYDKNTNPLGVNAAKTIMLALIRTAISERRKIGDRVKDGVSDGSLTYSYEQEMKEIAECYAELEGMQSFSAVVDEELSSEKTHYKEITQKRYGNFSGVSDNDFSIGIADCHGDLADLNEDGGESY